MDDHQHDPIRDLEVAIVEARAKVRRVNSANPGTVNDALDAVIAVGQATVDAFRVLEGRRVRRDDP